MLRLHIPALDDLWFREAYMSDPETMSYNHAWGGTIPFPREKWSQWYEKWILCPECERYYRYLQEEQTGEFVGEIAYHLEPDQNIHIANIIIHAKYRNRGYGSEGLNLLCRAAKQNGLTALYDEIAADNPAVSLFLKNGFSIIQRTEQIITVKKIL